MHSILGPDSVGEWSRSPPVVLGVLGELTVGQGRMSDRFGRKPVLTVSMFGQAIAVALFGFSRELWQMILFRCLAGVFSGSVV
jgi:MFS family permease